MNESVENTVVGHMCYQFANEVECMSQVRVNPETGEFDASQSFSDMLDFTEGDTAQPESEFLLIGANRLAVARVEDPSAAYFNEESLAWSSRPSAGFNRVPVDAKSNHVNAMLLRVVDLKAFKDAVGQVHAGVQEILKHPMDGAVTQSPAVERPVQRPRP